MTEASVGKLTNWDWRQRRNVNKTNLNAVVGRDPAAMLYNLKFCIKSAKQCQHKPVTSLSCVILAVSMLCHRAAQML